MTPDARTKDDWRSDNDKRYGDDIQRVTVWEFYDVRRNTMCVFTAAGDEFLVDPRPMPYKIGVPFVQIRNYDVPDFFYPIGELESIEPLQYELNATRSDMVNHRRRYNRAYLARTDVLSPEARTALTEDRDNRIIPIEDDRPLGDIIQPLAQTPLDPQMYQHSSTIQQDINTVSGVSEYQRGDAQAIRRTATEASIMQDAANSRAADKLSSVEDFIARVGEKMVILAQQFVTGPQVVRLVGAAGAVAWVKFDRSDLEGEFDFEVEGGSTQPIDEQGRRQSALQLLNAIAPYVGAVVNPQPFLAYVMERGFGIKNPEQFLMAPPPPGMPGAPDGTMGPPPDSTAGTPAQGTTLPLPGQDAVPPNILAQLAGQVGFNANTMGGNGA